jgi:redox-sensitive bicupin YhaK (pirin superfamily)
MLWDHDIPRHVVTGTDGSTAEITVIAGELAGQVPPPPPPHSWAARGDADVAIWHARFDPGGRWTMPPARAADTVRTLYVFEGTGLTVEAHELGASTGAIVTADVPVELVAGAGAVELLVLQGRPIGEPVAQYGPFVMNTRDEIAEAFDDYQRTQFGGWPWPCDAPTHGAAATRFARHADGRVEEVVPA